MNPWLERRVLNIAHQGGDHEAPSNTLFAFSSAIASGAHMLELDVHATADGHIVVCHDPTVDRTTNGTGPIDALTLAEVQALDAAFWFSPGRGPSRDAEDRPLRGVATGARPEPNGLSPADLTIPTLADVLRASHDVYVSIDIKRGSPGTTPYEREVADLLHEHGASERVVVASFDDEVLSRFRALAPHVSTSAATNEAIAFVFDGKRGPFDLLQLPFEFEGNRVVTPDLVARAHDQGIAIHVWTVNDPATMEHLIGIGVDGIVTDRPSLLAGLLARQD